MKLIVGLGNPGDKYAQTRHNLGFMVVKEVAKRMGGGAWGVEGKFKAEVLQIIYEQQAIHHELILAKPLTFMNNSGMAVTLLVNYFKIKPENIIIIHDDLDLPLGKIKVRLGGAAAGHHGVESVINSLGTDKFIRIRLGIGNLQSLSGEHKHRSFNAEHFVLEPFLAKEMSTVRRMIKLANQELDTVLAKGLEKAQTNIAQRIFES